MAREIIKLAKGLDTPILIIEKGRPGGVATLDEIGRIPVPQGQAIIIAHVDEGGDAHPEATPQEAGFMSAEDKSKLDAIPSGGIPAGAVLPFAMLTAPPGWLPCDGREVSRIQYAKLFAAIGIRFGVGDGITTFNLPDLRGEFVRGWDNGRGVDPGRQFGSWQEDEIKAHSHQYSLRTGTVTTGVGGSSGTSSSSTTGTTQETGGSETRPRNVALLYCIKY